MQISNKWKDYEVIDAGNGEKLERWNNIILRRPDPEAMWNVKNYDLWNNSNAIYHRSDTGGGYWEKKNVPDAWNVSYHGLTFKIGLTNFKHTGLFPEQASNWDYIMEKISKEKRSIRVLNLFAYTGGATLAASKGGASEVVHVDASSGMIAWAKENVILSGLESNKIRFICEDCLKFVQREARRGSKYDVIIMDPPSYGRGPNKEVWKTEDHLYILIDECMNILSDKPLFFLVNSYTTGLSSIVLDNILKTSKLNKVGGSIQSGDLVLPIKRDKLLLPCGVFSRWEAND
ncbi:MAG: class I SAM-dependent methyltransferase [Bacilli bacterium]